MYTALFDWQAKSEIKKRFRALRLPYSAHQILKQSLDQLQSLTSSRVWGLPPTKFADEIQHYTSRHKALGLNGPRPILRKSLELDFAEEMAIKIDASINFLELAISSDLLIKPILLYYSCAHLCGVYTRVFFDWQQDDRHHGLNCTHRPGNVVATKLSVAKKGQFPRLATTCFLLSGWPSCFSELVTYYSTPTSDTGPGELLEKFGQVEKGSPKTELTLDEIITFDYGQQLKPIRQQHGFHKFKGLPTTAFLIDVITLFVGSSLARYDVIGWGKILEGKTNSYRIHFEETFERFQNSTVNYLLAMLENPSFSFDQAFHPTQPSPYSHADHTRFKGDPNYAS